LKRLFLGCLLVIAGVTAFTASLNLTVSTDKATCHVGDPVTISARAVIQEGTSVTFQLIKPNPDENEDEVDSPPVWGEGETTEEKLPDGYHLYRYTVTVRPFKLGSMPLGKIKAVAGDETVEKEVPSVEVVSMFQGGKQKETINPLKPQLEIKPDYSHLIRIGLEILAALLMLSLLIFVILKLVKRFRNRDQFAETNKKKIPAIPPCVEVRELLGKLLASSYLKDGRIKEFYVELAEIGKSFLGRAFQLDYSVETSEEMLDNLAGRTVNEEDALVREFLEACDMVKFAKLAPLQGETNSHVNLVYKLADAICNRQSRMESEDGEETDVSV